MPACAWTWTMGPEGSVLGAGSIHLLLLLQGLWTRGVGVDLVCQKIKRGVKTHNMTWFYPGGLLMARLLLLGVCVCVCMSSHPCVCVVVTSLSWAQFQALCTNTVTERVYPARPREQQTLNCILQCCTLKWLIAQLMHNCTIYELKKTDFIWKIMPNVYCIRLKVQSLTKQL